MRRFLHILLLLCATLIAGCDATIHEYPDNTPIKPTSVPFTLDLDFTTDMPIINQTVTKKTRSGADLVDENFDLRYIINVYRATEWRQVNGEFVKSFVFTKDDVSEWNHSVEIELDEGDYDIIVWADFVDQGTDTDKYYNTERFDYIYVKNELEPCNDYRDAFIGYSRITLTKESRSESQIVPMERPLAKYRFISNDLETFVSRMLELKKKQQRGEEEETKGEDPEDTKGDDDTKGDTKVQIDINDYYVVFEYTSYVNTSFNALLDIPAAPSQMLSYRSEIKKINEVEAELGFDYIFVNGVDTKVWIALAVFEKGTDLEVARVEQFLVELSRSKCTEVRGPFLTTQETGGVGIVPEFDDEFTVEIH